MQRQLSFAGNSDTSGARSRSGSPVVQTPIFKTPRIGPPGRPGPLVSGKLSLSGNKAPSPDLSLSPNKLLPFQVQL